MRDISRSLGEQGGSLDDCAFDGLDAGSEQLQFLCGEDVYRLQPGSLKITREVGGRTSGA